MRGRNLNLLAFILICAAITYHQMKKCQQLPWPPRFIFAGMTFFIMEAISLFDETLSGVMAIGMVIAIFVKEGFVANCNEGSSTGQPQTVKFIGQSSPNLSISEFQQQQNTGQVV